MDKIPREDPGKQEGEPHYVCVVRNGEKRAHAWSRQDGNREIRDWFDTPSGQDRVYVRCDS